MVFIYFHVKCLIMDNNFISYQCLLNTMEDIYPVFPLPDNKQFKICIDFIKSESFALPVIEFCYISSTTTTVTTAMASILTELKNRVISIYHLL